MSHESLRPDGTQPRLVIFTPDLVARAEGGIVATHPVVAVFDQYADQMSGVAQASFAISEKEPERVRQFVRRNYGFLADALEALPDFSLEPLDLLTIWSRAIEVFPKDRSMLARMIATAYATQGIQTNGWRGFPRFYLKRNSIPVQVLRDKVGLSHVKVRLDQIKASERNLYVYAYGVVNPVGRNSELQLRMRSGDTEAKAEYQKFETYVREHSTPLIDETLENLGLGLPNFRKHVEDALERLNRQYVCRFDSKSSDYFY